jgi:predicted ester cyclase
MTTEEMKALVRRAIQAWNDGKPEIVDEVYAPNFVNYFNGEDRERLKQAIQGSPAAFSDLHITDNDFIVEGDKVVVRWTARCLHSGVFLGVPATGKRLEWNGIHICRVENGKIVDVWSLGDDLGLLRQMGALP